MAIIGDRYPSSVDIVIYIGCNPSQLASLLDNEASPLSFKGIKEEDHLYDRGNFAQFAPKRKEGPIFVCRNSSSRLFTESDLHRRISRETRIAPQSCLELKDCYEEDLSENAFLLREIFAFIAQIHLSYMTMADVIRQEELLRASWLSAEKLNERFPVERKSYYAHLRDLLK